MKSFRSGCRFVAASILASLLATSGCTESAPPDSLVKAWGRRGLEDGRFLKPRGIAVDKFNPLYTIDTTGRIQLFYEQQQFLRPKDWQSTSLITCGWSIPAIIVCKISMRRKIVLQLGWARSGAWANASTLGDDHWRCKSYAHPGFLQSPRADAKLR